MYAIRRFSKRVFASGAILGTILILAPFAPQLEVFAQNSSPQKQKLTGRKKCFWIAERVAVLGTYLIGIAATPTLAHDINARLQDKKHIGMGIYLDFIRILSLSSTEERLILLDPNRDPETVRKISSVIASKVHGDYAFETTIFPLPRDASTYIKGQSKKRGVCRNKVCVVQGVLWHLGINSFVANARLKERHVFLILPDYNLVVEPTWASQAANGFVLSLPEYEDVLRINGGYRTFEEDTFVDQVYDVFFTGLGR